MFLFKKRAPRAALGRGEKPERPAPRENALNGGRHNDELPPVCVDTLARADHRTFFVRGWWRGAPAHMELCDVISPEGARVALLPGLHCMPRTDLPTRLPGETFTAFRGTFTVAQPSALDHGWRVAWARADGHADECALPAPISDRSTLLNTILSDIGLENQPHGTGAAEVIDRFIQPLLAASRADARIVREHRLGPPPLAPEVSVLVPLYARCDFVEHQLLQFSRDPEFRRVELLYLLDSPELEGAAIALLEDCVELYGVSARLLVANRNCGYAVINNLGAKHARAPHLVFLNSDAFPLHPGWLSHLAAFYRRHAAIGALGPKLVFEDGSLQHAGEEFQLGADGCTWEIVPCFKGLHRSFAPANVARPVAAVTGACLMIGRALFGEVGGFDEGYVQGDFEDSDLCLRLAARGLQNWYCPEVELHHFEGASYPSEERARNLIYNRWRHTQRCHRTLEHLASAHARAAARPPRPSAA